MSDINTNTLNEQELLVNDKQITQRNKDIMHNAVVLANVLELSSSVISSIAGRDVSNTLSSETVTKRVLLDIIANRIKNSVKEIPQVGA